MFVDVSLVNEEKRRDCREYSHICSRVEISNVFSSMIAYLTEENERILVKHSTWFHALEYLTRFHAFLWSSRRKTTESSWDIELRFTRWNISCVFIDACSVNGEKRSDPRETFKVFSRVSINYSWVSLRHVQIEISTFDPNTFSLSDWRQSLFNAVKSFSSYSGLFYSAM